MYPKTTLPKSTLELPLTVADLRSLRSPRRHVQSLLRLMRQNWRTVVIRRSPDSASNAAARHPRS